MTYLPGSVTTNSRRLAPSFLLLPDRPTRNFRTDHLGPGWRRAVGELRDWRSAPSGVLLRAGGGVDDEASARDVARQEVAIRLGIRGSFQDVRYAAARSRTGSESAVVRLRYPTSKMRYSIMFGAGKRPSPRNSRAFSQPYVAEPVSKVKTAQT